MLVLASLLASVNAHTRLLKPLARTSDPGLKVYPCGDIKPSEGSITTLSPGRNIITWEETINHVGAPFRIALSKGNDEEYDQHILYDHIPHNDAVRVVPRKYMYAINLPDVNCKDCFLQLIMPMTDKISAGAQCNYPTTDSSIPICQSVYHTCADIHINGTAPTLPVIKHTQKPYTQEGLEWVKLNTGELEGTWYLPANCPECNRTHSN